MWFPFFDKSVAHRSSTTTITSFKERSWAVSTSDFRNTTLVKIVVLVFCAAFRSFRYQKITLRLPHLEVCGRATDGVEALRLHGQVSLKVPQVRLTIIRLSWPWLMLSQGAWAWLRMRRIERVHSMACYAWPGRHDHPYLWQWRQALDELNLQNWACVSSHVAPLEGL